MTKMKSKKMTKSTFAIIIMAIAMVAMLAFGGTYAYFTASAETVASGKVTFGTVQLSASAQGKFATEVTGAMPGDTILTGGVQFSVAGSTTTAGDWVAFKVTVEGDSTEAETLLAPTLASVGNTLWDTTTDPSIFISKAKVDATIVAFADGFKIAETVADHWTQNGTVKLMGKSVTITIASASIQGENIDSQDTAETELLKILNPTQAG